MLKNYIKIAWRNVIKNKSHACINIVGLSIGIACSLLILLWVQNERSVDSFHENDARLYKVYEREYYSSTIDGNYDTPGLLAEELKRIIPEIEDAIMLHDENDHSTLQVDDKILKVEGTGASAAFFSMFSYPLVEGTAKTALSSIASIAISRKTADQLFNCPENAMGKTIRFDNKKDFTVTAVFENFPANVSRIFDYAISWEAWQHDNQWSNSWESSGPLTYVLLRPDANPILVAKKLTNFLDNYNKNQNSAYRIELDLQKFQEGYLHSSFKNGKIIGGRIEYVNLFSIVAVFILLIACINFMNLSTARSVKRAKEIGVRKVIGALRSSLIKQFIGESLMLTTLAVSLSLILVYFLLPVFNEVTQKQIVLPFEDIEFWFKLITLTFLIGIISGSYPALFLSAFNPITVLKGSVRLNTGAIWFRKGLVVFQFVLSLVLIMGTIVVSKQISFIQKKNLGYDRENLIYIPLEGELVDKYTLFKERALARTGIKGISNISDNPSNLDQQTNNVDWEGRASNMMVPFEHPSVGYDFVRTMNLKLLSGRDFSKEFPTDPDGYILNEKALEKIGYEEPIGKSITVNGRKGEIIGVLKDFNFRSLHEQIQPMVIALAEKAMHGEVLIRTEPGKIRKSLANLKSITEQLNPQFPFTYSFSDEEYQKLYRNEQVVEKLSNGFAFLALFISSLGLLGLVIFTAEQRTREIGIRKVLGATVSGMVKLLTADFLKLVFVAIVIASPIAWWLMGLWLDKYAYSINMNWWMFVLAGALLIFVALMTVSFQAVKAAMANPVDSLKDE